MNALEQIELQAEVEKMKIAENDPKRDKKRKEIDQRLAKTKFKAMRKLNEKNEKAPEILKRRSTLQDKK